MQHLDEAGLTAYARPSGKKPKASRDLAGASNRTVRCALTNSCVARSTKYRFGRVTIFLEQNGQQPCVPEPCFTTA
jgi:hypothetical protein